MEKRLFSAVWRGCGHAVPVERIFDVMWADHPSGGPDNESKYRSLQFHVFKVRQKLFGTMYRIEFVGQGDGYRLTIRDQSQSQRAAA
ncbi:MAG: hypothetical protein LCH46_07270 [Proteobacteria bacterium]|nr:hypothetical protein [Pseudomonadota bacterium]